MTYDIPNLLSNLQQMIFKRLGRFEEYVSVISNSNYIIIRISTVDNQLKRSFVYSKRELVSLFEIGELALLADTVVKRYNVERREFLYGF